MVEHSNNTNMPPELGFDDGKGVANREVAETEGRASRFGGKCDSEPETT